jgi:capsular exopolysaccharide synthesis family protein
MNNDDLNRLDAEPAPAPPQGGQDHGRPGRRGERGQDDAGGTDREVHFLDYVRVLYKRRWMAATVFAVVLGVTVVQTFTETPLYEAKTRLLIESGEQNVVSFRQVVDENQTRGDYYQTQHNILQSRALARRTLDAHKLWQTPPFGGAGEARSFSLGSVVMGAPSAVIGAVRGAFGSGDAEGEAAPADETAAESHAIDVLLSGLTVTPIRGSRLVDVKFRSADPLLARTIANGIAKSYIEQNLEYKFLASQEASGWLAERLAEQRKAVEDAELALQRYREQNDAISLEDSENIVVQKLTDLNAAVTRAKTVRIEKEALYNQLRASQTNAAALDTFPAILTNGFIQQQKADLASLQQQQAQLSEKLGDRHPDMQKLRAAIELAQAKLGGEIGKVVQSVRSEYQSALAQETSLVSALNQQKAEAQSMNRKAIDYGVLQRDVDSSKQIYDNLLQRAKETGVAGELKTSSIRVVDEAERPGGPVTPRVQFNLMVGLLSGLLLAGGLAFFFEYLDSRIKTPDDITRHLGLPHLGMLPAISPKLLKEGYPLITAGVPATFSEAFKGLRTNVLFSTAQQGSRSIAVTSTGPGEGKSMVAANMAVGFAQAGQRVLLIDADMRKPKVHEIFGLQQEPGLSNLLVGQSKASETVRKSSVQGLWVLTSGRLPPNPAELVGSTRFRDFLASLKEHFDWVIVDSPPVMAVTDASLIANHVYGVLFIVGADMTSRHAAGRALDQLERAHARFVGAVLNRADFERNPYYYSEYYRREYTQYYVKTS